MTYSRKLASLLLLTTAFAGAPAWGQSTPTSPAGTTTPQPGDAGQGSTVQEDVEISSPGADTGPEEIVVRGRFIPQPIRATPEVISVLSSEDIARTGEGDIAGALQRVTGLSVVGGRFVFVRGLGERYSLALLNGSPLPSPEPLRRVVPLDLFPTSIVASTVVQKSYSVNYPGEFGGGVINITTRSVPDEPFLTVGASIGGNSETTFERGYTYEGGEYDWTGFDDGTRDVPRPLRQAINSGNLVTVGANFSQEALQDITASLVNAETNLIQRNDNIPGDFSADVSAGTSFDVGDDLRLGVIATVGYDNGWQTRGGLQQTSNGVSTDANGDPFLNPDRDFRFLSTEQRVVVNALLGLGAEFGDHRIRLTNLYIRDTLKEARIQAGTDLINVGSDPINRSFTNWFERQLFDTQVAAEFEFDALSIDLRGTYANSQRESPYERLNSYRFNPTFGDYFNDLRTNGALSTIAFSDLSDDVYGGQIDLAYELPTPIDITVSAGYNYYENQRSSTRRDFRYQTLDVLPAAVSQERPDYLLSDFNISTYGITLTDLSGLSGAAAYDADLTVHSGYGQVEAEITDTLRFQAGVRYEDGKQSVLPIDLFNLGGPATVPSEIDNDYFLPAGTVTWNFAEDMQLRVAASKTIARPQFRELAPQQYLDTESDRTFFGNQFLEDSELFNAEARWEYYLGRDERITLAGFYKKIDRPIEAIASEQGGTFFTTFANAPEAQLYGGEIELQKYFPLDTLSDAPFLASRRVLLIANYTYTDSEIKVSEGDTTVAPFSAGEPVAASLFFRDGTPLTGQSDHIANVQIGLEDTESLSQQVLLLNYASERVTNRGPSGQPDLVEDPGFRLDFVARQGFEVAGTELALKFEVRNITDENYEEFQSLGDSRIDNNTYDLGRSISLGVGVTF